VQIVAQLLHISSETKQKIKLQLKRRRSSLKKGKMYICNHNLIFSCYCAVAYITGCGPPPPVIIAKVF
jgi:hypothetical protein